MLRYAGRAGGKGPLLLLAVLIALLSAAPSEHFGQWRAHALLCYDGQCTQYDARNTHISRERCEAFLGSRLQAFLNDRRRRSRLAVAGVCINEARPPINA